MEPNTNAQSQRTSKLWADLRWRSPYCGLTCLCRHIQCHIGFFSLSLSSPLRGSARSAPRCPPLHFLYCPPRDFKCVVPMRGRPGHRQVPGWGAGDELTVRRWCPVTVMGADGSKKRKVGPVRCSPVSEGRAGVCDAHRKGREASLERTQAENSHLIWNATSESSGIVCGAAWGCVPADCSVMEWKPTVYWKYSPKNQVQSKAIYRVSTVITVISSVNGASKKRVCMK